MPRIIIFLSFFLMTNAFGYDCESTELKIDVDQSKKELIRQLKSQTKQSVFEGLIYEVSDSTGQKSAKRALAYANFLAHTEADAEQRSFIELLTYSAELESGKVKALKLEEICDLNAKLLKMKQDKNN